MRRLTATEVKTLRHPGGKARPVTFPDGEGLVLQVTLAGSKSWLFRFQLHGRAREMGLGSVATTGKEEEAGGVSLARARELAREARALLRRGVDPIARREVDRADAKRRARAEAEHTFRAAAEALIDAKRPGWRSPKHAKQWSATLEAYAYPAFGDTPVARIGTDEVLRALRPVWTRAPETASRLRQRIEAVLDAARVKGWRSGENPARWKGHLDHELPAPRKVRAVEHHPALPWPRVGDFMRALREKEGKAARALRFAVLTVARSGEVRGMRWREVDLEARVWTVPAERMKARRTHRVPLSDAALAVLTEMREQACGPDSCVFPGARGAAPLSDMALSMLVRGMCFDGLPEGGPPRWRDAEGNAVVPHGLRSTFRDWAGETRPEGREVVEAALAHTVKNKAEAAYARSDLLERRRALMDAWAEQCLRPPAETHRLHGAHAERPAG